MDHGLKVPRLYSVAVAIPKLAINCDPPPIKGVNCAKVSLFSYLILLFD